MRCYLIGLPLCLLFMAPHNPDTLPSVRPPQRPVPAAAGDNQPLSTEAGMVHLAREDPIAFLENCLRRCGRSVSGFTAVLEKQERISGELRQKEELQVCFRDQPHSVYLCWIKGARLRGPERSLYVEGENDGRTLVRPKGPLASRFIFSIDPDGPEARDSARYSLREFGLRQAMERFLRSCKAARDNRGLFVEYLGEEKPAEAGGRACWVLKRRYTKPEADGVMEVTIYVDTETWLQVGTVVKDRDGELLGTYWFRDIRLNPTFAADQFQREALWR